MGEGLCEEIRCVGVGVGGTVGVGVCVMYPDAT